MTQVDLCQFDHAAMKVNPILRRLHATYDGAMDLGDGPLGQFTCHGCGGSFGFQLDDPLNATAPEAP